MKNIKCRSCFFYRNEWCEKIVDSPDPEEARDCNYFREMTNADRIRAMTDEEMLQWITAGENCVMTICDHICGGECNAIAAFKKSAVVACKEIVMKWLQQPVEEDDHGVCRFEERGDGN